MRLSSLCHDIMQPRSKVNVKGERIKVIAMNLVPLKIDKESIEYEVKMQRNIETFL